MSDKGIGDGLRAGIERSMRRAVLLALGALVASCTPGRAVPAEEPPTRVEVLREIQLTQNARLPEQNDGHLVEVEVFPNRLVFHYSAAPKVDLEVDDVVAGVSGGGYLRRLTDITEVDATTLEATTVPAELGELIGDGHFIIHFRPGSDSYTTASDRDPDVGGTIAPLEGQINLLPEAVTGVPCDVSAGGGVDISPRFGMTADADIEIDLRWSWDWWRPRGELHYARFELSGSISPGVGISTSRNGSVSCEWDVAATYGADRLKAEWVTPIPVGPIVIPITHTVNPAFRISVTGSVQTGPSTMNADGTIGFRTGAEYTPDAGWQGIWDPTRTGSVGLTASERGTLAVSANASGGVEYFAKLFDAAGPGIELGPSLTGEFRVTSDLCTWEAEATGGMNATVKAKLEIPVIDHTLAEANHAFTLAGGQIAYAEGTFPWCEDSGMPVEDGGMPPPPPMDGGGPAGDAGPDTDAGSDACTAATDCQSCNEIAGCGYCAASGACVRDSQMGSCEATSWRDSLSECEVCDGYGSCGDCLGDAFCGWCASSGRCMTATTGGSPPEPCGDWLYTETPSMCR